MTSEKRKKSFPILLGFQSSDTFREAFLYKKMSDALAVELANELKMAGIEKEVKTTCAKWTQDALDTLELLQCESEQKTYLKKITNDLLIRSR